MGNAQIWPVCKWPSSFFLICLHEFVDIYKLHNRRILIIRRFWFLLIPPHTNAERINFFIVLHADNYGAFGSKVNSDDAVLWNIQLRVSCVIACSGLQIYQSAAFRLPQIPGSKVRIFQDSFRIFRNISPKRITLKQAFQTLGTFLRWKCLLLPDLLNTAI